MLLAYTAEPEAPLLLLFGREEGGMCIKITEGKRWMAASREELFESSERQRGKTESHHISQSQLETSTGQGACVCTTVSWQSCGLVLKLVPVLTEASPA